MDKNSTPGEIKWMVKCAMGTANYQGSMTGETIFGIDMIDGEVAPTAGGGMVSLQMVLFSYVKMEDKNWARFLRLFPRAQKPNGLSI